jgi:Tol biopolymer transport system component
MRNSFLIGSIAFSLFSLLAAGCGQGVQDDRSVNFSGDGKSVAIRSGKDGVFVVDPETGKPRRIFEPQSDLVAASAPMWSPAGKRLIFATARLAEDEQRKTTPVDENADGGFYAPHNIVYTCWLRDETKGADKAENVKLFEAECNHTGYIGANLAVRWHPKGDRILYLDKTSEHRLNLFEFALDSKRTSRVFSHDAEALVFDWDPTGKSLAVVAGRLDPVTINLKGGNADVNVGGVQTNADEDGLWLHLADNDAWWHVPQSHELARGDLTSLIERLRATLPAWTDDGKKFAFATSEGGKKKDPGEKKEEPVHHTLRLGNLAGHDVAILAEGDGPYRDLHWSHDGDRIGFVRGTESGALHLLRVKDRHLSEVRKDTVVRFAGWDHSGNHLAYVAAEPVANDSLWTTLLLPEFGARNAVFVADGEGTQAGKAVFSGMHVTFPKWSPSEKTLSLVLSFTPSHPSLVTKILGQGAAGNGPAATLDVATGRITWTPTNAFEKAQIGHYHLSRHDFGQAWNRYAEAERDVKPAEKGPANDLTHSREFLFFQYYCLTKLGRDAEAREKLDQFDRLFSPPPVGKGAAEPDAKHVSSEIPILALLQEGQGHAAGFLRNLHAAEALLSLNAAEEAQVFFEKELQAAPNEEARISAAVVLSQIHLLRKQHVEYARLATDLLLPYALKNWRPATSGELSWFGQDDTGLISASVLALAPLASPDFLQTLPQKETLRLLPRWTESRTGAKEDAPRLGLDLILRAAHDRLGMEKEKQEIADRIAKNSAREALLPPELEKSPVAALRNAIEGFGQFLRLLRGM